MTIEIEGHTTPFATKDAYDPFVKKASISKSFLNLQKLISTSNCQCKKLDIKESKKVVLVYFKSSTYLWTEVDEASL